MTQHPPIPFEIKRGVFFKLTNLFIMYDQFHEEPEPQFSLWYFLAGRERSDNLRNSQTDHRGIITTGIISLLVAIANTLILGMNIQQYIDYAPVSISLSLITFFFLVFFHRVTFIFSEKKSKSKAIIIGVYILIYGFLCYLSTRVFLYYFLESELSNISKEQSSLNQADALIQLLKSMSTTQSRSIQNMRFLIMSILYLFSLLPLINHLLSNKNQNNQIENQNQLLLQHLQHQLLQKKLEYANLNNVSADPNDPFSISGSHESIDQKRQDLLSEILHLQRAIQLL